MAFSSLIVHIRTGSSVYKKRMNLLLVNLIYDICGSVCRLERSKRTLAPLQGIVTYRDRGEGGRAPLVTRYWGEGAQDTFSY